MKLLRHPRTFWGRLSTMAFLGVAALLVSSSFAQAGPLSSANIKVFDDAVEFKAPDLTYTPGGVAGAYTITVTGSTKNFTFTALIGESNQGATGLEAKLTTTQVTVKLKTDATDAGAAHSFKLQFSDISFSVAAGVTGRYNSSGSVTFTSTTKTDSSSLQSYVDLGNTLFGTGTTSGKQTITSTDSSPNSGNFSPDPAPGAFTLAKEGDPFSMSATIEVSLHVDGSQASLSSSLVATTPEPASTTLVAIGALGMAGYGWRRRKQSVNAASALKA